MKTRKRFEDLGGGVEAAKARLFDWKTNQAQPNIFSPCRQVAEDRLKAKATFRHRTSKGGK